MVRRSAPRPDLTGQVIVITGGNSGIGKEAAVELAAMGATVVITARDQAKGAAAVEEICRRSARDAVEVMALDLADFGSIRSFAAELLARHDRLDVLSTTPAASSPIAWRRCRGSR
jgi:NAD(P)-dependent dehydrogenase (short-subunit alcohol dehydrogenase family)